MENEENITEEKYLLREQWMSFTSTLGRPSMLFTTVFLYKY